MANIPDFEQAERSLRGADWRSQLADGIVRRPGLRRDPMVDSTVGRAVEYLRMLDAGRSSLAEQRYPDLIGAERIRLDPAKCHPIQMWLMADSEVADIAQRTQASPEVVTAYEALHFDVRTMLPATDWIYSNILLPAGRRGKHQQAAELRLAYWGGRSAVEALLTGKSGLPMDRVIQAHDAALLLHAKMLEALEMPLTPATHIKFLRMCLESQIAEKRLELRREELKFQMEQFADDRERRAAQRAEPSADADATGIRAA